MRRSFPGYAVAAVSTVALVLSAPGQTMLLSLLNLPLREEIGIDAFTLNTLYTVATVGASLPLVWIGRLTDRIGPRRAMILVALSFGAACAFVATIAHVAMVFVAFFLLRFLGQGSLTLVSGHALAMWFHRRLGTLMGLRAVVLFAVWAPLPGMTLALIDALGWRATWAVFGLVVAGLISVLAWRWLHDRPEDLGLGLDGADPDVASETREPELSLGDAMRTRAYWLLAVASMLPPMVGTAILFDIQPLLGARGMDPDAAAGAVGAWSATMAVMALPSGHLVDRLHPRWTLLTGTAAVGASSALLLDARGELVAVTALALFAVGQSFVGATVGATAARYFGRRHHGAIRSSLARIGVIATGLGPLVFGVSQRWTEGYDAALIGFAAICVPAATASVWLAPPPDARRVAPG